jgi:hypothetical protein
MSPLAFNIGRSILSYDHFGHVAIVEKDGATGSPDFRTGQPIQRYQNRQPPRFDPMPLHHDASILIAFRIELQNQ